jgi:hypothetical protein
MRIAGAAVPMPDSPEYANHLDEYRARPQNAKGVFGSHVPPLPEARAVGIAPSQSKSKNLSISNRRGGWWLRDTPLRFMSLNPSHPDDFRYANPDSTPATRRDSSSDRQQVAGQSWLRRHRV